MAIFSHHNVTAHAIDGFLESLKSDPILHDKDGLQRQHLLIQQTQLRLTANLIDEIRFIRQELHLRRLMEEPPQAIIPAANLDKYWMDKTQRYSQTNHKPKEPGNGNQF